MNVRPWIATTLCGIGVASTLGLGGCGCSNRISEEFGRATAVVKPRDKEEPALLLLYMDDSASMDENRNAYGTWAIQLLRAIKPEDPEKLGIHFATFRSRVTSKAELKYTGKASIEKAIIDYEDAHPVSEENDDQVSKDHRERGTSLKELLKDANTTIEGSKAETVYLAIFCDGGVEDGPNGDLAGALKAGRELERLPSHVKDFRVLVLGLSEDNNGDLIRQQEGFWSKIKVKSYLGRQADTDAVISSQVPALGKAAK